MITETLLNFLHGLATSVFAWARETVPSPPAFLTEINDAFATVLGLIPDAVLYFIPLGPAIRIGLALAGLLVAVGLVVLGRRVLSLFTGGGGNA